MGLKPRKIVTSSEDLWNNPVVKDIKELAWLEDVPKEEIERIAKEVSEDPVIQAKIKQAVKPYVEGVKKWRELRKKLGL